MTILFFGFTFYDFFIEVSLPKAAEVKPKKVTVSPKKKKEKASK